MNEDKFDMPIGFGFSLIMNPKADKYFANLDIDTKNKIKEYIQNNTSSDDAKYRINNAIKDMENNNLNFLKY